MLATEVRVLEWLGTIRIQDADTLDQVIWDKDRTIGTDVDPVMDKPMCVEYITKCAKPSAIRCIGCHLYSCIVEFVLRHNHGYHS